MDLSILNLVLYPLAPTLLPGGTTDFFLCNRVDILLTMVGGKVLHNSSLADVRFEDMDTKVNKWLGGVTGLPINTTSATLLRSELGVLPSQLVAQRNALYFLWHLRNEVWYRQHLPSPIHLSPLSRPVELLTDNDITPEEFHRCDSNQEWHDTVRTAILDRAQQWYDPGPHQQRLPNFRFVYRGLSYLRDDSICHLAPTALQARTDRLPGVPNAWEYHQCPYCDLPAGLNGAHLLGCDKIPTELAANRDSLRGPLTVPDFTTAVLACEPSNFTRDSLCFAQKLFKAARRSVRGPTPPTSPTSQVSDDDL